MLERVTKGVVGHQDFKHCPMLSLWLQSTVHCMIEKRDMAELGGGLLYPSISRACGVSTGSVLVLGTQS